MRRSGVRAAMWRQLEERAAQPQATPTGHVRQILEQDAGPEIHLAVSWPDLRRHVLVRIPDDRDVDARLLPSWRGATVDVTHGSERPRPRRFLGVHQVQVTAPEVFESLTDDICDALGDGSTRDPVETVAARLERWRAFFEEAPVEQLGREAQLGLYGELWFLRHAMIPRLGSANALLSWVGPTRAVHDFHVRGAAIEIKSSAARQHQRVHIIGERQLDDHGLDRLSLVVLGFSAVDRNGETLPEVVEALRLQYADQPALLRQLGDRLLGSGYLDAHAERYTTGYTHRSTRCYHIREGFPRIIERNMPQGVGDVAYTVMLSACGSYEASLDTAFPGEVAP